MYEVSSRSQAGRAASFSWLVERYGSVERRFGRGSAALRRAVLAVVSGFAAGARTPAEESELEALLGGDLFDPALAEAARRELQAQVGVVRANEEWSRTG